jgi:hypothetical protein
MINIGNFHQLSSCCSAVVSLMISLWSQVLLRINKCRDERSKATFLVAQVAVNCRGSHIKSGWRKLPPKLVALHGSGFVC